MLGGHFATLCQEEDFIIDFLNEKANNFTLLIILIEKRLQIELYNTNLPG